MLKTGVVVTNQYMGQTPVLKVAAHQDLTVLFDGNTIIFRPAKEHIECKWGGYNKMHKKTARKFGANYGIWFSS
jgi:hypothetical protein